MFQVFMVAAVVIIFIANALACGWYLAKLDDNRARKGMNHRRHTR